MFSERGEKSKMIIGFWRRRHNKIGSETVLEEAGTTD